jgi:hypothetical protein
MTWKHDLDALIESTMMFVQQVNDRPPTLPAFKIAEQSLAETARPPANPPGRTGNGGPIDSSMDENAGTKASPWCPNHPWSGLGRHPRNRAPEQNSPASSPRSLAIH